MTAIFKTRPGNVDDIHFITKSWFLTWVQSPENALRSRDSFVKRTDSILAKKDTNIAVVCYQDNPKYIAAFMVYTVIDTGAIIHCLYVRKNWQMQGIATELLQKLRNRGVEFVALVPRPPSNASPTSNAYCTLKSTSGQGVVYMDSEAFFAKSDSQRRWTVAHELLHCSFNVNHDDGMMSSEALTAAAADSVTWADVEKYCK
jgi:GNAT superfamily N-acetyltransferase